MPSRLTRMGLRLRGARFLLVHEQGGTAPAFGTAPAGFVRTCAEVLEGAGLDRAWVAQLGGRRPRLVFSANVPESARQRIRNAWTPPPAPSRGGGRRTG